MLRSGLLLAAGLVCGWLIAVGLSRPQVSTLPPGPAGGPEAASGAARIEALEAALAGERERRLELVAELEALEASVARLEAARAGGDADSGRGPGGGDDTDPRDPEAGPLAERLRQIRERRAGNRDERRVERLIAAGFAPDRAAWITQREDELRLRALQARYEARRTGEPVEAAALGDVAATLRAELGDADYERYLGATGRPTSVGVIDVMAGSPAESAGLRPGDRLVSYGGRRIYDVRDLNELTVEGTPGEPVSVDVVRDGQTIRLVIPRGPLGITGGGRRGMRGGVPLPADAR